MPHDAAWLEANANTTLRRLLPRLNAKYAAQVDAPTWAAFVRRLEQHFPRLFQLLVTLYSGHYDLFYHLERTLEVTAEAWLARSAELRTLDAQRESDPHWFQSNRMVGGVCYVDLFAGNLPGLRKKIPYFQEMGLTYLHLMPLFQCPEGNSDGGYAVSNYREVNPALGTVEELHDLAGELRHQGISLALDFIFNHTSDEHVWAKRALAGDPDYQAYYRMFPDRTMPDAYERTVREIFPDEHPGAFTFRPEINQWVWTTFHTFQWDLNYSNPAVFTAMAEEMLSIANLGVEILRLDAVAFIWKQMGTACENLPEAHLLIQAFNALCRMAAPALIFKSEAIVHPDEVVKYIRPDECQISYNPLLMALLWNSLATRKVRLLSHAIQTRFALDPHCAWVNYVRVHDDIGWTFSDEDAQILGIKGYDHRQFLSQFYTGRFAGSFARGLPFQENPKTGDCRISGTCASLAGLEKATADNVETEIELAVNRILLIHGLILTLGGIPLLYLGDEIGMLNDYAYRADPAKAEDSRWVHRPVMDWDKAARRTDPTTLEGRLYQRLRQLIDLRQATPAIAGGTPRVLDTGNDHVFGFERTHGGERIVFLANFSELTQILDPRLIGLTPQARDHLAGRAFNSALEPCQLVWLKP